jgi:hypothetical protein
MKTPFYSGVFDGPSSTRYPSSSTARASGIVFGHGLDQQLGGLLATIDSLSFVSSGRGIMCGYALRLNALRINALWFKTLRFSALWFNALRLNKK